MQAAELLRTEHRAIELMLDILEGIASRLESGQEVEPDHLRRIADFIQTFADRCHHGKEEGLLFPAMEEAGVPRDGGPIGVMLVEHEMGRGYVRRMVEGIGRYADSDGQARSQISESARAYVALLRQHIDKEDNILYPIAEMHLTPEVEQRLPEGFDRIEREQIGENKHEEYHELLHELRKAYLGQS